MYHHDAFTDYDAPTSAPAVALRYTVMVLAMTVGISILLATVYDVHPMMLLADRVNEIVAGLGR